MDAFLELGELFSRMSGAASLVSICAMLKQYSAAFGLTRVSIFDLRRETARASEAILCTDVPQKLLHRLDRAGDFFAHPLVERARRNREPFEILGLRVEDRSAGDGVLPIPAINGLVIPVHDGGAVVAMAALTGAKPLLNPLAYDTLKLAVQAGWHRLTELASGVALRTDQILTPRESECLRWVAKGKTDREIARILSVSPRTVRFHVDNAKEKLNVATRIQAVTKLMREQPDLAKE